MKIDLIVSRHSATAEFIARELGARVCPDACVEMPDGELIPVLDSATPADVAGKRVAGNLPLHLAALAAYVVAVEFSGQPPRGAEYALAEMDAAGAHLVRYEVTNEEHPCPRCRARDQGWDV